MILIRYIFLSLLIVLFPVRLSAQMRAISEIPTPGLKQRDFDEADLIIIGKVKPESNYFFSTTAKGTIPWFGKQLDVDIFNCHVEVLKILKGTSLNEISARFYVPHLDQPQWSIAIGRPVLLLLKYVKKDGVYELAVQPESWMTLSRAIVDSNINDTLDTFIKNSVLGILERAEDSKPTSAELKELQLNGGNSDALTQVYVSQSNYGILQALGTVAELQLNSAEIRDAIRKLWISNIPNIEIKALNTSLELNDSAAMAYCVKAWRDNPKDQTLRTNLEFILSNNMKRMKINPDNLSAFNAFLNCEIPAVRSAAMLSLRQGRNPISLPLFVAGLNDTDKTVRYHAMLGMYYLDPELFKEAQLEIPFLKLYNSQPDYYISTLKKWLSDGGLDKLRADLAAGQASK